MQWVRVQSLVGELRSHIPCSVIKKKKKEAARQLRLKYHPNLRTEMGAGISDGEAI